MECVHAKGRAASFAVLVDEAAACRACPRMDGRRRLLSTANGPLDARVLFVAEAPGRLGGERTGVPLQSDQTGRNFTHLLATAGLARDSVFVTNAVLCNPRDAQGRNAPPSATEIARCQPFLQRTIEVVAAPVVVALGRVALAALARLEPHERELRRDVGRAITWRGRILLPLYHPGPRAQIHRPLAEQEQDFVALATLLASLDEPPLPRPR